jgi:2,3-bisphosphoglycerate-independent phosphoglycerate mutase
VTDVKIVYVLLDGIGDLPHPSLNELTPLEAAYTPNLDSLSRKGAMGRVISVGKGIAPQSDIAVFNMLGYSFRDGSYVGRGVISASTRPMQSARLSETISSSATEMPALPSNLPLPTGSFSDLGVRE